MTIQPIEETPSPLPVQALDLFAPSIQDLLNSYKNLPVDLIDEQVNQTSVMNVEAEIRENGEEDLEAYTLFCNDIVTN